MKSQKGITLTSVTIYIVLVLIVVAILATVTSNFQSSVKEITKEGTEITEIDKFNMFFLQEVKKQGNGIEKISNTEILFKTGNKYTFNYNSINLNDNIIILENIENCEFSTKLENGKIVIIVKIKIKDLEEQVKEYVLSGNEYEDTYVDEQDYIN